MIIEEQDKRINDINEMIVHVDKPLPLSVSNSIYYNKLKFLLFNEIVYFCKEKVELKSDLLNIRSFVGDFLSESEILTMFDELKVKYNENPEDLSSCKNIGVDYHLETTKLDYAVVLFVIIKRDDIYAKQFIFRFRKAANAGLDLAGLNAANMPYKGV